MSKAKDFLSEAEDQVQVPGYGTLSQGNCHKIIVQYLEDAKEALDKKDYKTLNLLVGKKGSNGVLGSMATALKDTFPNE